MATLVKPKKKNKKQTVPHDQRQQQQEEEDERDELSTSSKGHEREREREQRQEVAENASLLEEFERVAAMASSGRSKAKEIVSHDCCISSDVVTTTTAAVDVEPQINKVLEQLEDVAPSAPSAPMPSVPLVQYPNLQPMRVSNAAIEEQQSPVFYRSEIAAMRSAGCVLACSQLKAFTNEQLKEIYQCPDLDQAKQFELEFLMSTLLESSETDPLYLALQEYYILQGKLSANLHYIKARRKECQERQQVVWKRSPVTRNFIGHCDDNNVVSESITYDYMEVDLIKLEAASAALNGLYNLVCHTYTTNLINAKITKVKIDQIINELLNYPDVDPQSSVELHSSLSEVALTRLTLLRRAIGILFNFVRRPSPNANFEADLKLWLRKLIALQLLLATKEDHWFLLFNILRCPNGVGAWAAEFLQLPGMALRHQQKSISSRPNELPLPLNSPEINHCVAVLQILLLPIKKRNEFLKSQAQAEKELSGTTGNSERWTVVDSDGEETLTATGEYVGVKECDLIALLNQLPFDRLFSSAMGVEKFLEDYLIEPDMITAQKVLTVLAFFAQLVETLGEGMLTYNNERYKQLAKRLGRLVRHSLQYIFDYHELFLSNKLPKSQDMCERIELELQALLIRACSYIYRSRNLGTWQYFSTLPYATLHADFIWHLFYYLNVGFPVDLNAKLSADMETIYQTEFWSKFDVANADISPEDMYYLLQAFFEMANDRDITKDRPLIRIICLTIFQIGFIHQGTREFCYKTARDMLVNISLVYEDLLDCLLVQLKARFGEIEQAAYLFKALPLENWRPSMESFELLSNWLLHFEYQATENQLARLIIAHLNWGFDNEGRFYLPHNIHVRMACLVTEAITKHAPEVIGASSISESVRQVSSLIDSTQSSREQFTNWCWRMISMLRLHLMDQSTESVKRTLQHPTEPLLFVPDLKRFDMIWQGVSEQRPLALYVGVLVSLHGHSIPVICQHGFELLQQLLGDHRHAAVIRSLELIIPLFLETPDTLANCESFQKLLITLLNADRTYLKLAKDMVYANSIGPILELLDNMLHHQIISYTSFGLCSPLNLINVWLNCFTTLPDWPQNSHVLYLLDKMLCISYQFTDCRVQAAEFFYNYFKDCSEWKIPPKSSGLKGLFGGQANSRIPQLCPQYCWLNMVLLDIEFRLQETRFWPEFLRQLASQTVDQALKKTLSLSKTPLFPAKQLVIYKYAQLLASMDTTHPLFPIVCQKFFELYLWRVPVECDVRNIEQNMGVAEKFFEHNVTLMKTVKTQLKTAEVYYAAIATKRVQDEAAAHMYRSCTKLMQSCALWLEDTQINRFANDATQLPAQYNSDKLRELLNGYAAHWTEFLCLADLRKDQREQANHWTAKIYRTHNHTPLRSPLQAKPRLQAVQRIKHHLTTYDKRLAPPIHCFPNIIQTGNVDGTTLSELKKRIQTLNNTANKVHNNTMELNSLNLNYLERIPALYQMVPYEEIWRKECTSLIFKRTCTKAAEIKVVGEHIRRNDQSARAQEENRQRHDKIVEELLALNVDGFAQALNELGRYMSQLLQEQTTSLRATTIGVEFFYFVVDAMNDTTMKFPPTKDFYTEILDQLGVFIQEEQAEQGLQVLRLALRRGDLVTQLAKVFVPCQTDSQHFLEMYQFLIDSHLKRCDTKILFVLLSKFDLLKWLEAQQPKLSEINRLLLLVLQGLESWSQPHSSLLQDQFRRQLVHIFTYDFPQHYGEVMQLVLDRISDQKLMPVVLLDLLNALLATANSSQLAPNTTETQLHELAIDFARRQKLFTLKAATDTLLLFARHFQKERLHHGLHGLYPKHKEYCQPLVMWFTSFGHVLLAAAICSYQELLADQISDIVFGSIVETYAPWLIPYTENTELGAGAAAHWIRQLSPDQGKVLLPWSEAQVESSKTLIRSFIASVLQVIQYLPASNKILEHTFAWYVHHFAQHNVPRHVLSPLHEGLSQLPWERFQPPAKHIELFYESLQRFVPESHAMLGHIFIRIDWNTWFAQMPPSPDVLSSLFDIFVKMAFEPNIHMHPNTSKILEDAIKYPWHLVEYSKVEHLLKWLVASVEPAIVLKLPTESNYADRAVLDLLRVACAMLPESSTQSPVVQASGKRMLYTRSIVRMQRACGAKHKKLLATKEGERSFTNAFLELLQSIDQAIGGSSEHRTPEEQRREALNLMLELIAPTQTQSEEISNLHIQTMIRWQAQSNPANPVMCAALPAIGHLNTFISSIYMLLESSITCYFRKSTELAPWHAPSWQGLFEALQMSLPKLELMPVLQGGYFFSLHVFVLYKLEEIETDGEKITFLQDLTQLLENQKTDPITEPRLALVWGLIIARGCKILQATQLVKKPLCMLARHLQIASTKAESWSDGLLGAIGLKSENITNRRKVLTRCLACVIFSLFPASRNLRMPSEEYESGMRELAMLLANKKFVDVKPLIVRAVSILKEQPSPDLGAVPHLICRLIDVFYEQSFLTTIPEVWDCDFKLKAN